MFSCFSLCPTLSLSISLYLSFFEVFLLVSVSQLVCLFGLFGHVFVFLPVFIFVCVPFVDVNDWLLSLCLCLSLSLSLYLSLSLFVFGSSALLGFFFGGHALLLLAFGCLMHWRLSLLFCWVCYFTCL